jgi:peptidyl-tRNA hydrolase, PTH1 family
VTTDALQAHRERGLQLLTEPDSEPWILVPLGNPGEEYTATRHNLGRLMVQRWIDARRIKARRLHLFETGTLYSLRSLMALVPATYMNLSGQVCKELVQAGFPAQRILLVHDDKDLPLGIGRLKLEGGDGGHNGLRSVFEHLGTSEVARFRLGLGPFTRPLHDFVLGEWTDPEWEALDAMDTPFAAALDLLGTAGPLEPLMGQVNAEGFWRG